MSARQRQRVVIAGGGVAALETMLALHALAPHRLELTLLTGDRYFVYRPVTVAEAFDRAEARAYQVAAIAAEHGASLVADSLSEVDPERRTVLTGAGARIDFDHLVVATGAKLREPLRGALTFRGREDVPALRDLLAELVAGTVGSVALTLPSERVWPLPLYELALMTAGHLREHGAGEAAVSVVTPEEQPLELFGPAASRAIEALLTSQAIALRTGALPKTVHPGTLVLTGGGVMFVDRVVTVPVPEGPALAGLPHDQHGFVPVDRHGRVKDVERVYAAGDVTTFPLKQGGLAAQQGDAVAETIAAELGVPLTPHPFRPVLRGLLMTGGAPLYLRAEPHRLEGDASVAVDVAGAPQLGRESAATGQPLWWPPSKIAGRYLAPYLSSAPPESLSNEVLTDRAPIAGAELSDAEHADAVELALTLAGLDARWGDYRSALEALDAAEALEGALPPEYEAKRREWRDAERTTG